MNPIHYFFSKVMERKPFSMLKKGHISKNNWWILLVIEIDLHFMIIYLCIKFESNTLIFSKDNEPFFNNFSTLEKGRNSKNNRWILP